ncbi:copper chaperone PCu(A)C, partial [Bordetella petrii]|uniref:copper chaperone PCu(A)C n=1 Tax=Bordetella petrii TaxID=94624 RepID=UPI001E4620A3
GHGMAPAATAQAAAPPGLAAQDCRIRNMPKQVPSAGYFTLANHGQHEAVLVGVGSDAYARTMLHASTNEGGMAGMAHVDRIAVPAGGSVQFAPGGYHAMLEKPVHELQPGDQVTLTLAFEAGGALAVPCTVHAPADIR